MNRERRHNESYKEYRGNLKQEQRLLDYRLGTQYGFRRGRGIFAAAGRFFSRAAPPIYLRPKTIDRKARKIRNRLARKSRRVNRLRAA